jgi:membrane protein DedA with SNARE-associated domain
MAGKIRKKVRSNLRLLVFVVGLLVGLYLVSSIIGSSILKGTQPTLSSFIFIHFSGYLFFILSPVELFFLFLIRLSYNAYLLIFLAVTTAMFAQLIDYMIGYFISDKFIVEVLGEKKYESSKKRIEKYGSLTIFLFNLLPLSSPIIALVAGMLKYKLKKALFYSFVGLLLKYILIAIIF